MAKSIKDVAARHIAEGLKEGQNTADLQQELQNYVRGDGGHKPLIKAILQQGKKK